MTDKEPLDVYSTENETHAPKGYRIQIDKTTGDIYSHGPRTPPPEWIPDGWVQIAPNRWAANWPICRFRRLNIKLKKGEKPEIQPLCIKYNNYGEEIDVATCLACTVYESLPIIPKRRLALKELVALMGRDFSKLTSDALGKEEPYHMLIEMGEEELESLEEREFQRIMDGIPERDPSHLKNRHRLQERWGVPCAHRIYVNKSKTELEDCGGCSVQKIVCNNPAAEAFGKTLTRKICKNCPVAESPDERAAKFELEKDQWMKRPPKN